MHAYGSDPTQRMRVYCVLISLAVGLAFLLGWGLEKAEWKVPWWLDTPAVFGFFGSLYGFWETFLWRVRWARVLVGVDIPILAGKWKVEFRSSYDNFATAYEGELTIKQTWSRMVVLLKMTTTKSRSHSVFSNLQRHNSEYVLAYLYTSKPDPDAVQTMHPHDGAAWITIHQNGVLEGQYFTGRGRATHGTMTLSRI